MATNSRPDWSSIEFAGLVVVQVQRFTLVQDGSHFHGFLFGFETVDGLTGMNTVGQWSPADHMEVHEFIVEFYGVGFRFHHVVDSTGSSRFGNHSGYT